MKKVGAAAAVLAAAIWPELAAAESLTVHVPAEVRSLSRAEAARVLGELSFVEYAGDRVARARGEVVVFLKEEAPAELAARGAVGLADQERRFVFLYVRNLERAIGTNSGDPEFRLVLGRVLAHELEHLRRGAGGHDPEGWMSAVISADNYRSGSFWPSASRREARR